MSKIIKTFTKLEEVKAVSSSKKALTGKKEPKSSKPTTPKVTNKKVVDKKSNMSTKSTKTKLGVKTTKSKAGKKFIPKIAIAKKTRVTKKQESKKAKILPKPELHPSVFSSAPHRPIAHLRKTVTSSDDRKSYNPEELLEFEKLILEKLEKSKEEYSLLKSTLNRTNDAGIDSTSGGNMKVLEDGAETAEKENLSQLASRQLKYINNLEGAMVRIKNGTYGICTVTGKLIAKERLVAVPHTTQSIEAKMNKFN